ncbi:MAG TPA: sensor histidine kinase [Gammaproteobacteria bacterium]|nr:sensor histidine kinase [Gammaproteobacteria bacterium]
MNGRSDRLRPSIRRRLFVTLFLPAAAVLIAGTVSDYFLALPPYTDAFDQELLDAALVVAAHVQKDPTGRMSLSLPVDALAVLRAGSLDSLFFRVSKADGTFIAGDADLPTPPRSSGRGSRVDADYRGADVRLIGHNDHVGNERITVAIAETTHQRDALRERILLTAVTTDVVVLGLILALIWFSVRMSLGPLAKIEHQVAERSPEDVTPISIGSVPAEIRSLIAALNRSFTLVFENAASQRRFLENAAHQLRTPLAGIQAQLELMAADEGDPERKDRVRRILDGARRLSHTTQGLLTLARADASANPGLKLEHVDLASIMETTVTDSLAAAEGAGIDLGAQLDSAPVHGIDWLLGEAAKALVGNAITHTPAGGSVTVRCGVRDDAPYLEVNDTGVGIPPTEREKVVDRFFRASNSRGTGSGLGLAIAKDVATLHRADLALDPGPNGVGTTARITFPRRAAQTG